MKSLNLLINILTIVLMTFILFGCDDEYNDLAAENERLRESLNIAVQRIDELENLQTNCTHKLNTYINQSVETTNTINSLNNKISILNDREKTCEYLFEDITNELDQCHLDLINAYNFFAVYREE